jgi:phosphotransferase family enzyme
VTRELVSDEPWSTVWRVEGGLWLKKPKGRWQFEVPLTVALASRWPDRVPEVVEHGDDWLLTRDAGARIGEEDPLWLDAVRRYVELQQGEAAHADEHVAAGVPDRRLATLPRWYDALADDVRDETLRRFSPRFAELCAELASHGIPETIQHDDLHQYNVYVRDGQTRIMDWGDSCVSHPYFSLVATLRHVPDRGISRAFLDAWNGDEKTLALALRVGRIAHAFKHHVSGDDDWPRVLALAIDQTRE